MLRFLVPLALVPLAAVVSLASFRAAAADLEPSDAAQVAAADGTDLVIEVGAGVLAQPAYEGSDNYIASGYPIISVDYLSIPGLFETGGGPKSAFSIGPSFRYIDERNDGKYEELQGTRSVDETYELGLRAGYEFALYETIGAEIYGEGRAAFGGADGFVGALGMDLIGHPAEKVEIKAGPRTSFASADYMDTYFSVSEAESAASGGRFEDFDADAGFKSVGVTASARYEFRENWFLNSNAAYDRLVGDAADSPIVDAGSKDQFFVGVGLSRRFELDLF